MFLMESRTSPSLAQELQLRHLARHSIEAPFGRRHVEGCPNVNWSSLTFAQWCASSLFESVGHLLKIQILTLDAKMDMVTSSTC